MTTPNASRARTLVYIAGPFTGKGATRDEQRADTEQKIQRAERLGIQVARLGAYPVIPHCNTSHPDFEDVQPYQFWIEGTEELLLRSADAVLFTPDWQDSDGARGEERTAAERGIPRFYSLADLACWLLPGLAEASGAVVPVLDTDQDFCGGIVGTMPSGAVVFDAGSTLTELARQLPTLAPESNLSDPFSPGPMGPDDFPGSDFDDEPGTSPEIPSLRARPAVRPPSTEPSRTGAQ